MPFSFLLDSVTALPYWKTRKIELEEEKKTLEEVENKTCLTQLIICYFCSKDSGITGKSLRKQKQIKKQQLKKNQHKQTKKKPHQNHNKPKVSSVSAKR